MVVGIISNLAAMSAQYNLSKASSESQASIYRLSSGQAIYQASDNVAGLAIGTILQTNVSTLKTALTNTAQASSLLGVADGALQNIGSILQQQKSLAVQATSGSLTDSARGFLNQAFQSLSKQIDQISQTTNFNGINLIDGSLFTPADVTTKASEVNSVSASGTIVFATAGLTAASTLDINGVTFTYSATPTAITDLSDSAGSTGDEATNLYNAIQNVLNSSDPAQNANKAMLSGLTFTLNATNSSVTVTSKSGGISNNTVAITGAGFGAATDVTVNGTDAGAAAVTLSAGGIAGVDGDLTAGTFAAGGTSAYSGTATTIAQGIVGDNILTAINTTGAAAGHGFSSGVVTNGISNNEAFTGKIDGLTANYLNPGYVNLSVTVGSHTYTANNIQTAGTAANIVRMSAGDSSGGYFDLTIDSATNTGQAAVTSQDDANKFAGRINTALSGINFYQARTISSFNAAGSIFAEGGSTVIGNLTGSNMTLFSSNFDNAKVDSVSVVSPPQGGTTATIQIEINGETYTSGYDQYGVTLGSGKIGTGASTGTSIAANAYMGLVSTTNPKNMLVFHNNASTALDVSTTANAQGVQQALEKAFGISEGNGGLSFQVGSTLDQTIGVQLEGAKTTDIFVDENGNSQTLSVNTKDNANAANPILDRAIESVTALRATVGALMTRFNYASNNLNTAIQNQDAARGIFLDTDISTESTNFAQSQVRVQASVSVLAQANQQTQNLLKLLS
jgi:flagellin